MAEEVGHEVVLEVDISSTWTEIGGVTSCSINRGREVIDITDFADTSGARKKLMGLKDGSISLSLNLDLSDAGQGEIYDRWADGADLDFGFKWDGSAGTRQTVACKVESINETGAVEGVVTAEVSLTFNGVIS